ncbi:hypothetical protein V3481_009755 [Fusarium oxysporum f. sp. vasinfectum]
MDQAEPVCILVPSIQTHSSNQFLSQSKRRRDTQGSGTALSSTSMLKAPIGNYARQPEQHAYSSCLKNGQLIRRHDIQKHRHRWSEVVRIYRVKHASFLCLSQLEALALGVYHHTSYDCVSLLLPATSVSIH